MGTPRLIMILCWLMHVSSHPTKGCINGTKQHLHAGDVAQDASKFYDYVLLDHHPLKINICKCRLVLVKIENMAMQS